MNEPNPEFDAIHPSGHILFRSCRGGYLHSVVLAEAALSAEAGTLAEAIKRTAEVSYHKALMEVRDEIIAAGHTPSDDVPGPRDLGRAIERLREHRLEAED